MLYALAAVIALLAIVLIRTLLFTSKQVPVAPLAGDPADDQAAAVCLSKAITFPTISYVDWTKIDGSAFLALHDCLAGTFPRVHAGLKREVVSDYALLYTWPGQDPSLKPILLMAHLDVVPIEQGTEGKWTHPPFSGQIADGFVWGRGAADSKFGVIGALQAVETLLAEGFQPKRTVYLAFGCDEEVSGRHGAASIAALLESRGVQLEFLVDEGGAVSEGIVPGVAKPVAIVGIAEKGYLSLQLTAESAGGHSAMPPRRTTIGTLGAAVSRLEKHPFPARLAGPVRLSLDTLGPEMPFGLRLLVTNRWLFGPLLRTALTRSPEANALLRTTTAPTIFQAGVKDNILPQKAQAVVNFRIRHGETAASTLARVRQAVETLPVKVDPLPDAPGWDPSPVSDLESPGYALLQKTIRQVFPAAVVVPYLVTGATDARYYARLTNNLFRFSPMTMNRGDFNRAHGTDERVAVADCGRGVTFYRELIRGSAR